MSTQQPTPEEVAYHLSDIDNYAAMIEHGAPGPFLHEANSPMVIAAAYRALLASQPRVMYMAAVTAKRGTGDLISPLSYGIGTEPAPERLLMRGRGTLFNSVDEAQDAIEKSGEAAIKDGHRWPMKYRFLAIECHQPTTPNQEKT